MIIVRTKQNMSYYGNKYLYDNELLKVRINSDSNIYIHIPENEITEIIHNNKKYDNIDDVILINQ